MGVGKAHGSAGGAFERAMHGARVAHEVGAGPGKGGEEVVGEKIAFEGVTAIAR